MGKTRIDDTRGQDIRQQCDIQENGWRGGEKNKIVIHFFRKYLKKKFVQLMSKIFLFGIITFPKWDVNYIQGINWQTVLMSGSAVCHTLYSIVGIWVTYCATQWAAVRMCVLSINEPPQNCLPPLNRAACGFVHKQSCVMTTSRNSFVTKVKNQLI